MKSVLIIVVVIVVALAAAVVVLRVRKLRRDGERASVRAIDRRLMSPPPSPYATSKGFRLVNESGVEDTHREPMRPRLEPNREYVFNDNQVAPMDPPERTVSRQRDEWALSRSARRPRVHVTTRRVAIAMAAAVIIIAVLAYGVQRLTHAGTSTPTTTTTTTITTKATIAAPRGITTITPSNFSGQSATYHLTSSRYTLTVTAQRGPTWVRVVMGPHSTLEFQGVLATSKSEQLSMSGDAAITIGSPSNGLVKVDGASVQFPTPLPTTLTLRLLTGSATG